jgi:hypothetical protein
MDSTNLLTNLLYLFPMSPKPKAKPDPQQNGRSNKFPTTQVRIGEEAYNRFLRYCREKKLFVSQTLTAILEEAMRRRGIR